MFEINNIEKFENYPIKIKKELGEELIKIFKEKQLEKSNNRFFFYELNGYRYLLFEELIFEEGNFFLGLNRVLDKNFFLDREKI